MLKRLLRSSTTQAILARMLGLYLAFALRTTRWVLHGAENVAPHVIGDPLILAAWHERLPLMTALWLMVRNWEGGEGQRARVHIMISRSRDGRFIAAVVRRFGIDTAAGSTSRGGAAAMRTLVALLASGSHVGITPDGPRGPRRRAAAGVAQLAALSGAGVLPTAAQTSRRWVLRSWDRMVVPKPFGRGVVVCGPVIRVPRADWREALPAIETALNEAADRADALCGLPAQG
ncbi:MAG: lysophospholipid acyltransferase family protein [Alphaproteobacteria bacterium]|nr:lysophospholipid acyltransferase family protein [Alphaproteobacteria bacterium]